MDGDEQIRPVEVGHACPVVEADELVVGTGLYDFHVATLFANQFADASGHFEVDFFFERSSPGGPLVVSAMSGIDDQNEAFPT